MKTAVVTGASSGLGREYVLACAKDENIEKIVVVARRQERLAALQAEVGDKVVPLPLDLTAQGSVEKIEAYLDENQDDLVLLINNAGYARMGEVVGEPECQCGMIDLNCRALTTLCCMAANRMQAGGRILNVSSIAAFVPTPNLAVYGATKAFVLSLSKAMHAELRPKGVCVTAVCPGPIDTEFFAVAGIENSKLFDTLPHVKPGYVVPRSLKASKKGRWVFTPHPIYKLYRCLAKCLPDGLLIRFTRA